MIIWVILQNSADFRTILQNFAAFYGLLQTFAEISVKQVVFRRQFHENSPEFHEIPDNDWYSQNFAEILQNSSEFLRNSSEKCRRTPPEKYNTPHSRNLALSKKAAPRIKLLVALFQLLRWLCTVAPRK